MHNISVAWLTSSAIVWTCGQMVFSWADRSAGPSCRQYRTTPSQWSTSAPRTHSTARQPSLLFLILSKKRLPPPWSACKTRENSQHTDFLCGVGCMQQVSAAGLGAGWTTPSSSYTLRKLGNYLSNSSKLKHHDCGTRVDFVGRSHTMSGMWYKNESARLLIYSYMHMQLIFCPLAVWLVWLFWQGLVAASIRMENWAPVKIKYVCDIHTVINIVLLLLHRKLELLKKIRLCIKSMMPRMIFYA